MRKNIRIIGGLGVIFAFLAIGFLEAKEIKIETVVVVKAKRSETYDLLKDLNRFPEWSPFVVEDPKQKNHVTGKAGEIGSTFHWEGVAEESKGFQTLASAKTNEQLRFDCTILKPFKANPIFDYSLKETENGVEVKQMFTLTTSFIDSIFISLFGVEKKMADTNKLGLERFKTLIEKESTLSQENKPTKRGTK
jgi:hypothetical protein